MQVIFSTVFLLVFLYEGEKWQVDLKNAKSSDFTFVPDEFRTTDFATIVMPNLVIWFDVHGSIDRVLQLSESETVLLKKVDGELIPSYFDMVDETFSKDEYHNWRCYYSSNTVITLPIDEELNRDLSP